MIHTENTTRYNNKGLGALGLTGQQNLQIATTGISTGGSVLAGTLVSMGAVGGPVGLAIGAVAAVGALVTQWLFAPDTKKIAATHIVDQVQPYLIQNLDAWNSSTKTRSEQLQALATFDALWDKVVGACSDPALGQAGVNCIQDRKTDQKGYSWFKGYRDPIANDPNVRPDPIPVSQLSTTLSEGAGLVSSLVSGVSGGGSGGSGLLIVLGVVGVMLLVSD